MTRSTLQEAIQTTYRYLYNIPILRQADAEEEKQGRWHIGDTDSDNRSSPDRNFHLRGHNSLSSPAGDSRKTVVGGP
jgi:hypothetical protein